MILEILKEAAGALVAGGAVGAVERIRAKRSRAVQRHSEWTQKYVGRLMRRTAEFERRIGYLEEAQSRIEGNLEDPSFWTLFDKAASVAGTTENETKHDVLARAVLERLAAAPDSTTAVASTEAVGLVTRLSSAQLDVLAVMSMILAIRPPHPTVEEILADIDASTQDGNQVLQARFADEVEAYLGWLTVELEKLPWPSAPTDVATAHLISVGAIIFDRDNERDLTKVLRPWTSSQPEFFSMRAQQPIQEFLYHGDTGSTIRGVWTAWMQHVTPTPAGLLVGIAAADSRRDKESPVDIEALRYLSDVHNDDKEVWDGRRLSRQFSDALLREIDDRIDRGHRLGGR